MIKGGQQRRSVNADPTLVCLCLFVHARVKALEMLGCLDQVTLGVGLHDGVEKSIR